jgi:hypothetical protein
MYDDMMARNPPILPLLGGVHSSWRSRRVREYIRTTYGDHCEWVMPDGNRCPRHAHYLQTKAGPKSGLDVHHMVYPPGAHKRFSVGSLIASKNKNFEAQRTWLRMIIHYNAPADVRLLCQKHHHSMKGQTHTPPPEMHTQRRPDNYTSGSG